MPENTHMCIKAAAKGFGTDKHARTLDTRSQVTAMLFCHLADCQSLRDITLGMKGISKESNHLGIIKVPSRNALSRQNKRRDAGVAREIYMRTREKLMGQQPYDCRFRSGIKASRVLLLDSSMVTLCAKFFGRAHFSEEKGAIKLHALFSFNDFLPVDIFVSDGKESDNNGAWDAETISALSKARWQIESFFKLIKQHLRIKSFVGTTKDAVLWQIWTAMLAILILQYLKARANSSWHMSNLIATIRIHLMSHLDLWDWLQQHIEGGLPPPNLCDEA